MFDDPTVKIFAAIMIGLFLLVGYAFGYEHGKTVHSCLNGCVYSDWFVYGKVNRTGPSPMYDNCSNECFGGYVIR